MMARIMATVLMMTMLIYTSGGFGYADDEDREDTDTDESLTRLAMITSKTRESWMRRHQRKSGWRAFFTMRARSSGAALLKDNLPKRALYQETGRKQVCDETR